MPFYVTDSLDHTQFMTKEYNVDLLNIKLEMSYKINQKLNLIMKADYFNYDLAELPWHMPNKKLSMITEYNIQDKILLSSEVIYLDKTYNLYQGNEIENPSIFDLNLNIKYVYHKNLSFFVDANNLTGKKYERWNKYPTYGFNLLLGLAFSF